MMVRALWVAICIGLIGLVGCAEEATSGGSIGTECTPNETLECTCINGEAGYQLCNNDGSGYVAPCDCSGGQEGDEESGEENNSSDGLIDDETDDDTLEEEDYNLEGGEETDEDAASSEEDTSVDDATVEGGEAAIDAAGNDAETDAGEGGESTDAGEGGESTDAGEGGESTEGGDDEPYVTGDGGPFEEKEEPVSCLTTMKGMYTAGTGGRIYRGHPSDVNVVTAPIREVGGAMLTGIELLGTGVCGRDTANGIWCWDSGIPTIQETDVWPGSQAATQILENDGEPLRVLSGDGITYQGRVCFVRTDKTIACWGDNGYEDAPLFPSTPGCNGCASYPVTVLKEGQTGEPMTEIEQVVTSEGLMMAVDSSGQLWVWGAYNGLNVFPEGIPLPRHHPQLVEDLPPVDAAHFNGSAVCVLVSSDRSILCTRQKEKEWIQISTEEGEVISNVKVLELSANAFGILQEDGAFHAIKTHPDEELVARKILLDQNQELYLTDVRVVDRGFNNGLHVLTGDGDFYEVHPYESQFYKTKVYDATALPEMFATPCLECIPKCGVKDCSSDGCGGQCWNCASEDHLCIDGVCVPPDCTPSCPPESCGDDGCGGSCGTCPDGEVCHDNECGKGPCIVDVAGRMGLTREGEVVYMCPADSNCKFYEASESLIQLDGEPLSGVTEFMHTYRLLTCGRLEDGRIACMTDSGAVDASLVTSEDEGDIDTFKAYFLSEADGSPMTDVVHLSSNGENICVVRSAGNLECWGLGGVPYLVPGDGDVVYPSPVFNDEDGEPITDAKKVILNEKKACLIRKDGSVWCWGYEGFGIGVSGWNDSDIAQLYPQQVEGFPGPVVDLSLEAGSACALLEDTSVWCWGLSYTSLIGITEGSIYEYIHYPEPIRYGPSGEVVYGVKEVVHGTSQHVTLLMENGDILSWGFGPWAGGSKYEFVPSPTWLPWNGLPIQDAMKLRGASGYGYRFIIRAGGGLISSAPKSGTVSTKEANGYYVLCQ